MMNQSTASTVVASPTNQRGWRGPKVWLCLEGLAVLATAVTLYAQGGYSWWLFVALLLAPDLAMLGYLVNVRAGSLIYNLFHTYLLVLPYLGLAFITTSPWMLAIGLIWLAHIGMDRMLGYGLKYGDQFKHTHLDEV
ncbi:MAG: DUF4260 domain-containing protein [Caldilineaceae bacterium]